MPISLAEQVPGVLFQFHMKPDGTSCMPFASNKLKEIFGIDPMQVKESVQPIFDLIHPDDLDPLRESIAESQKNMADWAYECRIIKTGSTVNWVSGVARPEALHDGSILWHGYILDVTHQKVQQEERSKTRKLLDHHIGFQRILARISTSFVNTTSAVFNQTVSGALKRMGEYFEADRCYVFLFAEDFSFMSNTHEWCKEGISAQINNLQHFPIEKLRWWWEQMQSKSPIHVPDVKGHPCMAVSEKEFLLVQQIQSMLCIPMINQGKLMGFFGLDRVTALLGWDEEQIEQFTVLGELISNAFAKHLAEEALLQSENQYRLLAENARDIIYRISLDPFPRFDYVSPSSREVIGYTPDEHYGNPALYEQVADPEDLKDFLQSLQYPMALASKSLTMRVKHKNGSKVWLEVKNVPVFVNDQLVAVEGIARDITEKKTNEEQLFQLNQELLKKKEELEELNKSLEKRIRQEVEKNRRLDHMMALQARQAALGEMIGNIAHQWRQPLNLLSLAVYDLSDAFQYEELDAKYMENSIAEINRIIQQMSKTIDDFRNYFKPQTTKTRFQARESVNGALAFVSPYYTAHKIKVEKDLPADVFIMGYSSQFEQVLINLLKNAQDAVLALPSQSRTVRVIARKKGESTSLIEIFNKGAHIPENRFEKLFDPYFSTKPEGEGQGLGLFIAKMIVETNMEGRIYCQNREDGVSFFVELANDHPHAPSQPLGLGQESHT